MEEKVRLIAKEGNAFKNQISGLKYKEIITYKNEVLNWIEIELQDGDLCGDFYSDIEE